MKQKTFHDFLSIIKFKENYQLKSSGLNYIELHVLEKIFELGECKTLLLSREMNIAPSTLIGILDKLEKLNLVTRIRQTGDKRIVLVSATDLGKEKVINHINEDGLFIENLFSVLNKAECETFISLLEKLNTHLEAPENLFRG